MRTLLAPLAVVLLIAGCVTAAPPHPPDPALAHFATIALAPVSFSTSQPLPNERAAIATVLEKALRERLASKGYAVVREGDRPAAARLQIDITYIWDGRLYGGDLPLDRLAPELRLYAKVTLVDLAEGRVLLRREVQGLGPIEPFWSPAPEALYTAPQRDLARRIGRLFPAR